MTKQSIYRAVAGALSVAALAVAALAGPLSAHHQRRAHADVLHAQAQSVTQRLASRLRTPVLENNARHAERVLGAAVLTRNIASAQVIGADGRTLAVWNRAGSAGGKAPAAAPAPAGPDHRLAQRSLLVSRPILVSGRPIGSLTLDLDTASRATETLPPLTVSALSVAAVLLAMAGGFLFGRRRHGAAAAEGREGESSAATALTREEDAGGEAGEAVERLQQELAQTSGQLAEALRSLEEQTQAKSRFLANMSHEIRTPLNGVLGMTELLRNTPLNRKQREFTRTLRSSAEGLLNIVNDILDFSRIESGKLHLETLEFDLVDLIEDVVQLHAESAQAKGLELVCRIPPGLSAHALGDPGRLRQVLTNLLSNAVKFTERGEVAVELAVLEGSEQGVRYALSVSDTGIGITPALQERIFSSFVQGDSSTTRRYGGSGLGLAISRQLVELMGGTVKVESEAGRGARFTVDVVLARGAAASTTVSTADDSGIRGLRALVVDDNDTNRLILNQQLDSWHVRVEERSDGPSALDTLRTAAASGVPFDVAILDMLMPDMDGLELARAIKAVPEIAATRLMLLTSAALEIDADALRASGIEQYTTKPARQSQLYNCLVSLIGTQPAFESGVDDALANDGFERTPLGGKVLLVEDNAVNQEVARNMLEDLGCSVRVVDNGRAAITACTEEPFDVVLMDCQMPLMDGFEATVALKEDAGGTGASFNTPIIALTANALAGDRERCLSAGMDDYISKPFKQSELRTVLARWLKGEQVPPQVPGAATPTADDTHDAPTVRIEAGALDNLRALQRPGRPDVLAKVMRLYRERSPALLAEMQAAGKAQDWAALQGAAHSLKSSSANLGAAEMALLCRELEERGRNCDPEGVAERIARLDPLFAGTVSELERIVAPAGDNSNSPSLEAAGRISA